MNPYAEAKARIKANPKCADPDEVISEDTPYVKGRSQWYGQTLAECEEWQGMVASMAQKNPPRSERTRQYANTAVMLRNARKVPTAGVQKGTAARALSRADDEPGEADAREVVEAWATWHLKETGGDLKALTESVMELTGCDIRDTGLDGIRQLGPKVVCALASKAEAGQGNPKARA